MQLRFMPPARKAFGLIQRYGNHETSDLVAGLLNIDLDPDLMLPHMAEEGWLSRDSWRRYELRVRTPALVKAVFAFDSYCRTVVHLIMHTDGRSITRRSLHAMVQTAPRPTH